MAATVNLGKVFVKRYDMNLKLMLEGGQSFRWKKKGSEDNQWIGVFSGALWILTQHDDHIAFTVHSSPPDKSKGKSRGRSASYDKILSDYLRVDSPLDEYYKDWSQKDDNFKSAAETFHGLRLLNQDPVENLFSFICSSNNNIARISLMVNNMCELYGEKICSVEDSTYYSFPNLDKLTQPSVEGSLRSAGFGYRAKFISNTALKLSELGGAEYLNKLKKLPYTEAKEKLLQFPGVGPKVADCICLMSLGHFEAVPVDTHVFQVACQSYLPHLKSVKSVTDRVYKEIGDFFRALYGPLAGWAHTILFCADLKKFQVSNGIKVPLSSRRKAAKRKIKTEFVEDDRKRLWLESEGDSKTMQQNEGDSDMEVIVTEGDLLVSSNDLHLRVTFNCGQTYRWKEIGDKTWRGVHCDRVWTLTQYQDRIHYVCHRAKSNHACGQDVPSSHQQTGKIDDREECESLLRDYFRLEVKLDRLYSDWSERDARFREVSRYIRGLRMTRQPVVENIFAFICSSNTTIARITHMVDHLCRVYGNKICRVDGVDYFSVPVLERLCAESAVEDLNEGGFGFRRHYVVKAAEYILLKGGRLWIQQLLSVDYPTARRMLTQLPGIGTKVADCICLTALDHLEAVPVDTHVHQLALKYYLPHLKTNTRTGVTKNSYDQISNHLRQLFGHYCGWAHTVLFCSELKSSADLLPSK